MTTNQATLFLHMFLVISGCVTQMDSFLSKFFPEVLTGKKNAKRDAYCKYDSQALTAFTSSLFIAGALSSVVASRVTKRVGRQAIMFIGGALFLAGSIVNAAAVNIAMLIVGRMLLGIGVGFTLQVQRNSGMCGWSSSISISPKLQLISIDTGCSGVSRRDIAREVARRIHLGLQCLRRLRHTSGDSHKLLHQPHPGLGLAHLPRPGRRPRHRHCCGGPVRPRHSEQSRPARPS